MREFFPFCLDILNLNEDVSPGGAVRPGNIFTMPESPQGCRPQYLLRSAIHKLLSYEPLLLKIIMCPLSGKKNCNLSMNPCNLAIILLTHEQMTDYMHGWFQL